MVCHQCGAEVTEEQRFCNKCGAALTSDARRADTEDVPDADADADAAEEPAPSVTPADPPTPTPPATPTPSVTPTPTTTAAATATPAPTARPTYPLVTVSTPPATGTDEMPRIFDGLEDVAHLPEPRQTFRLRLVFLLAVLGAMAAVMATVADVTDIFTTRPVDGIERGIRVLDDFGTNLPVAAYVGAGVMVFGGLLACFGLRWAAGLAGGAGLALAGWAGLVLGLAEIPIEQAKDITRSPTTAEPFTLTITRDVGWWLIAGAGVVGVLVFLASLRLAGTGRRRSLNPWIAAVGAVSTLVLAIGPLVPTGGATFSDNFDWSGSALPAAIFVGRLVQVGLIALTGVVGFLLVRAYGVGLAAGGVGVGLWLWITALGEIGVDPRGIADRNPGASDTMPHGVTTIGALLTITLVVVAAVVATVQRQRPVPRPNRQAPGATRARQPVGV